MPLNAAGFSYYSSKRKLKRLPLMQLRLSSLKMFFDFSHICLNASLESQNSILNSSTFKTDKNFINTDF